MNQNILIIKNPGSPTSLQGRILEYNNQSRDEEIHSWLLKNIEAFSNIGKLVIDARLSNNDATFMGIHVALHIRLTRELRETRFLPIAILSDATPEDILRSQLENFSEKTALLLFTKGTYLLSAFDVEDKFVSKEVPSTDKDTLREEVKAKLAFKTPDRGHDLANEWGAFRLANFGGVKLTTQKPASIFFKYKDFLSNNDTEPTDKGKTILMDVNCHALLIDDKADSGWTECISHILKNKIISLSKRRKLTVIKNYEDADKESSFRNYDVIFLDLRLLPQEDRSAELDSIEEFSGTKILKRIKAENQGTQVIIFTASNKIWHIQKLMDLGANGYYIKESPEFALSPSFSRSNFDALINSIKRCLHQRYLREVWDYHVRYDTLMRADQQAASDDYKNFYGRTKSALQIAFELLNKSSGEDRYRNLAFLTYFQIVEDYARQEKNFRQTGNQFYAGETLVIADASPEEKEWKIEYQKGSGGGGFYKMNTVNCPQDEYPTTLAKVSFILAYKFNKGNDSLREWGTINHIRNKKAAHGGDQGYVTEKELFDLLSTIELFLTNR